jgi:hypothetical protein
MPSGAGSTGELALDFVCVATVFADRAGDGNRTRTVSLGSRQVLADGAPGTVCHVGSIERY